MVTDGKHEHLASQTQINRLVKERDRLRAENKRLRSILEIILTDTGDTFELMAQIEDVLKGSTDD